MTQETPREAKVEKYEERPYDKAKVSEKEIEKAEDRQPDQIKDYHKKNKTLKIGKPVEAVVDQNKDEDPKGS